jgi:hypothetical protein
MEPLTMIIWFLNNYLVKIITEAAVQPAVSDMSTWQAATVPPDRSRRVDNEIYKQKEYLINVAFIAPVHFAALVLLNNLKAT